MSKLLCVGDLHLRVKAPSNRVDNFAKALEDKFRYILSLDFALAIFAGDLFDRHDAPYSLVEKFISIIQASGKGSKLAYIYGQHDQRYHTKDKANTPLGVLITATKGILLEKLEIGNTCIYGASWGDDIKVDVDTNKCNMLVIHKQITEKALPFDIAGSMTAKELFEAYPMYDYILSGDNHTQFTAKKGRRVLINAGSVMRTNISQVKHRPSVYLLDTEDSKLTKLPLPINSDVFDLTAKIHEQDIDVKIQNFVTNLSKEYSPELNFTQNLEEHSKQVDSNIKSIIDAIVAEAYAKN